MFDPSGNQIEPLAKDDLYARLLSERPCMSTHQAINQFRAIKVFDRNIEIVPGTTSTFWLAFAPPSMQMPGVWKFAIYEVPVQSDDAGRPTRTTRFDMRVVATQFVDTFTKDSPLAEPKLVSTQEVEGAGPQRSESPSPQVAAVPPPASQPAAPAPLLPPTKDTIFRVQVELKKRGFDSGPPGGSIGPKTREALRKFQQAQRVQVTGEIDTTTLEALGIR